MVHLPTPREPVRVAIVDDSRTIRRWLKMVLDKDARLSVVAEAGSGSEAREILRNTKIDVMTLDVDMPGMTGIDFLGRLMRHHPMPVVMVSALTEKGSATAVQALSLGAIDCIEKPRSVQEDAASQDMCDRIFQAARVKVNATARPTDVSPPVPNGSTEQRWQGGVILLGASTGGVSALEAILAEIDAVPWPVVIAQHMPENFLHSFSSRLQRNFSRNFYLATDGHVLKSGQAVLAMGKSVSTRLCRMPDGSMQCRLGAPSENTLFRPSVNDLFQSAADAGLNGVAGLLTGMGDDGANGLRALRTAGFYTLGQCRDSCVVYGMPKAAKAQDAVIEELDDVHLGRRIADITHNVRNYRSGRMQ